MNSKFVWISVPASQILKKKRVWLFCLTIAMIALLTDAAFAQEFSAKTLGDFGNVTVMEVQGVYDAPTFESSPEVEWPRQEIAKEFFRSHKDEYDFLVIFTNFDFQMPPKAETSSGRCV